MESSPVPAPAKRGCLWYFGAAVAGAFGLVVLLVMGLIVSLVYSPDGPSQNSILISHDNQTYLEAVTKQRGEGFLDPFTVLAVYYIRVGGWFRDTQRIQVYCGPHNSEASNIGFRRRLDRYGQLQIEVKRPFTYDEIHTTLVQHAIAEGVGQQLLHPGTRVSLPTPDIFKALEDSARARVAAKDSLVLTVFVPPTVFPATASALTGSSYNYDCRE